MASDNRILLPQRTRAASGFRDDDVSIRDVVAAISEGKWIIIIVTVLTVAAIAAWAFLMTPIYRGDVLMAARTDDNSVGRLQGLTGLASLAGIRVGGSDDRKNQAIALLTSRAFTEKFIEEHNLLPILFDDLWDSEKGTWSVEAGENVPTVHDGVRRFNDLRFVQEDSDTGLVTLSMEWKDPNLAAAWANAFVSDLNAEVRRRTIAEAQQSVAYLQSEAAKTSIVELRQAIYGLIQEQIQAIMLANVQEDYAFQVLDPAVVPEPDERARPKLKLMLALGFVLGVMLGAFVLFFRNVLRSPAVDEADGTE